MCRTALIQTALCSSNIQEWFWYTKTVEKESKISNYVNIISAIYSIIDWLLFQVEILFKTYIICLIYTIFWANSRASELYTKFSTRVRNMFWVFKTFSQIRGTQRTLNQSRATRTASSKLKRGKIVEKMFPYFWKFSKSWTFLKNILITNWKYVIFFVFSAKKKWPESRGGDAYK